MVPINEVEEVVLCPVDWKAIFPFPDGYDDALELLRDEWINCVLKTSISSEESYFVRQYLDDSQTEVDINIIRNLRIRRDESEKLYMSGVGRLSRLEFLRPSEHGKHFAGDNPRPWLPKQSFFYRDLEERTIRDFFWSWFDDAFVLCFDDASGNRRFARDVDDIWNKILTGGRFRIAIYTVLPIGHIDGTTLTHLAIDVDVGVGVVHAYPITETEAVGIMHPEHVRIAKPAEHSGPR